jgi:hypothetical protein
MFHGDWTHNQKWNPKVVQQVCPPSSYSSYFKYNNHDRAL